MTNRAHRRSRRWALFLYSSLPIVGIDLRTVHPKEPILMHARTSLLVLLGSLSLLAAPVSVQAQDGGAGASNHPVLGVPVQQLAALQTMNRTVGPMLSQANARNMQMKAFLQKKNMTEAFATFAKSAPQPKELSFEAGYKIAMQRAQSEQHTAISSDNKDDLQDNIAATKTMVQSEWAQYAKVHSENTVMSSFIQSNSMMPEYDSFSSNFSKQRSAEVQKRIDAENMKQSDAAKRIHAQFKSQQRYLMQHWDQEMHLMNLANSSGYIMERNRQSVVADSHEYPYLDSQTQPVLWAPQGGGYWGGSWYGGHADPYYDVWGYPEGADMGGDYDAHPALHRTETAHYHAGAFHSAG